MTENEEETGITDFLLIYTILKILVFVVLLFRSSLMQVAGHFHTD